MNLPLFAARGAHPVATPAVAPVASFVIQHHAALWHAARILGGYEHARLVDRLVEGLHSDPRLRKRGRIMLEQLVELLTLENVSRTPGNGILRCDRPRRSGRGRDLHARRWSSSRDRANPGTTSFDRAASLGSFRRGLINERGACAGCRLAAAA